ncbi:ATP-binding protein [Trichothermofontia sp.]
MADQLSRLPCQGAIIRIQLTNDKPWLGERLGKRKKYDSRHPIAGTSLGLAIIVQKCVTLHGGTVTMASEVGVGTTVIVKFPLRLSE